MGFADSPASSVQVADGCWSLSFDRLPTSQLLSRRTDEGTGCPQLTADCQESNRHLGACEL
jgi:hypothetical protein